LYKDSSHVINDQGLLVFFYGEACLCRVWHQGRKVHCAAVKKRMPMAFQFYAHRLGNGCAQNFFLCAQKKFYAHKILHREKGTSETLCAGFSFY
jgi:hypothetical protein